MAEAAQAPSKRPLSPHLQVYRLTLSMIMSGVHRITGLALVAGMVLMTWWLLAAAQGQNAYATFEAFSTSWFGRLVMFGFFWAALHYSISREANCRCQKHPILLACRSNRASVPTTKQLQELLKENPLSQSRCQRFKLRLPSRSSNRCLRRPSERRRKPP